MKEKYHIYNYLKNHEGVLIALVSGVAGFVIMALNFVLYITDRFHLHEWNCTIIPVENSPSRFYSLCIWFAFFVAYMFLGQFLGKAATFFQDDIIKLTNLLCDLKEAKKKLNKREGILKKARKQATKKGKISEFLNDSDIIESAKLIDETKSKYHSTKKDVIKLKNKLQLKTIAKIAILSAECSIPIALIKYIQTFEFTQSLKSTLLSIGILLVFLIPLILLLENLFGKKTTIRQITPRPLSKASFSDSRIIQNCKSAALFFVFIAVQILFNGVLENSSKQYFEIFSIENQDYASIYESEHYLIGEMISYGDSTITFYLNNQIVVEKSNLSIVRKKFKKIEKTDAFKATVQ